MGVCMSVSALVRAASSPGVDNTRWPPHRCMHLPLHAYSHPIPSPFHPMSPRTPQTQDKPRTTAAKGYLNRMPLTRTILSPTANSAGTTDALSEPQAAADLHDPSHNPAVVSYLDPASGNPPSLTLPAKLLSGYFVLGNGSSTFRTTEAIRAACPSYGDCPSLGSGRIRTYLETLHSNSSRTVCGCSPD